MAEPYRDKHGAELSPGDRVRVLAPFDEALGDRPQVGRIIGAFPHSDPQGFSGTITVDLGGGAHIYAPMSWIERIGP